MNQFPCMDSRDSPFPLLPQLWPCFWGTAELSWPVLSLADTENNSTYALMYVAWAGSILSRSLKAFFLYRPAKKLLFWMLFFLSTRQQRHRCLCMPLGHLCPWGILQFHFSHPTRAWLCAHMHMWSAWTCARLTEKERVWWLNASVSETWWLGMSEQAGDWW